jgi:hypothetical protein
MPSSMIGACDNIFTKISEPTFFSNAYAASISLSEMHVTLNTSASQVDGGGHRYLVIIPLTVEGNSVAIT